ncbi:hypothetical protein [Vibrio rhodolitus]|uniref:hypothetical protein n=1 Tax=Vibrio rhodolitus TaxID=2231649 RepID=UPI000E0AE416|nr:hypothetical protein [Vibrio rhodolitus]
MDDDSLAPFVDALASSLIVMVLVCIFFLIQTSTAITSAAKLEAVVDVEEDKAYSPISYREILSADLVKQEFKYVVNFKLKPELVDQIKGQLIGARNITFTIESRDSEKKSAVNIMRLLNILDLPEETKISTEIVATTSVLSKVRWEID